MKRSGRVKQVRFIDHENDAICDGIMLENGDIICLCCGVIFPAKELQDFDIEVVEVFSSWTPLTLTSQEELHRMLEMIL